MSKEENLEISIFDEVSGKFLDILQIVLVDRWERTHIPEIYEIFGREKTLKFLDIFSGVNFTVPSRAELSTAIRDVTVYVQIARATEGRRASLIRDLATRYEVTTQKIRAIYYVTRERLKRYDIPGIENDKDKET